MRVAKSYAQTNFIYLEISPCALSARMLIFFLLRLSSNGWWRSLVAHLTGGQGVAGSNPVHPTRKAEVGGDFPSAFFFWASVRFTIPPHWASTAREALPHPPHGTDGTSHTSKTDPYTQSFTNPACQLGQKERSRLTIPSRFRKGSLILIGR